MSLNPADPEPESARRRAPGAKSVSDVPSASVSGVAGVAAAPGPAYRYPPLEHYFGPPGTKPAPRRLTRLRIVRFAARARGEQQVRLAIALAIPVLLMEIMSGMPLRLAAVLLPIGFVAVQLGLSAVRRPPTWLAQARLTLSLAFVLLANAVTDVGGTWPLDALLIPIVAVGAALGGRALLIVGVAVGATLFPLIVPNVANDVRLEAIAIGMVALVIANGTRHVVRSLELAATRIRHANSRDRRRARQLGAVESVGRVLARVGPTSEGLDGVMALLEETFGYRYPSVYFWDGTMLRLAAQRNYRYPIETVPADVGVVGRVVRSHQAILLPDARSDPDFQSADPAVVSEIAIPLLSDEELLGILNVETAGDHRLDEEDFATLLIVGDRLTAAMALGRERQKLTERAELLDRFTTFGTAMNSSLDPTTLRDEVITGARTVIEADMLALVLLDRGTGEYRVAAITQAGEAMVGSRILPGEGVTGRAIAFRNIVVDDRLERAAFPAMAARARIADVFAAMAAPLVVGDEVTGALAWFREDTARVFSPQEREIATIIGGRVALALANAQLHEAAQEAAITDSLTGIHNRRHFDASMAHADALRARIAPEDRRERSAILFDLDHFGAVNKRYGHQVGDQILRRFADVISSRVRASDLLARYGGEEFVVILDGASREEAMKMADEIRLAFRRMGIESSDSGLPIITVSAGCAALDRSEIEGAFLLERADVGLAMAKAAGRDQVVAA